MHLKEKKYHFWILLNILCLMKEEYTLCCGNRSYRSECHGGRLQKKPPEQGGQLRGARG